MQTNLARKIEVFKAFTKQEGPKLLLGCSKLFLSLFTTFYALVRRRIEDAANKGLVKRHLVKGSNFTIIVGESQKTFDTSCFVRALALIFARNLSPNHKV